MQLLIIGIGNPTPSFIKRRLDVISKAGVQLTLVAEHGQSLHDFPTASVIRIGGKLPLAQQMLRLVQAVLGLPGLLRLMSLRPELKFSQQLRWAIKYLPLANAAPPDVIHFQWLSFVPEFSWLRNYFHCPFIGSARGSQITVYPLTRFGYKAIMEQAVQLVDHIHCVSNDIAQECEKLGATKEKIWVNYNGIDLQKFSPQKTTKHSDIFTIISVGGMMWRKGFFYQLQILKMLLAKGRQVQLLLVGDGPDREGLHYMANRLGIAQHVTFAGKVKSTELPEWLAKADMYLSTSMAEGLANSVVEAAACGLPVVAFACEGMDEVLQRDVNGFILPFGDVEGMVEKIHHLIDNPEEKIKMGISSRLRAVEKFDEQHWVALMLKKYTSFERK